MLFSVVFVHSSLSCLESHGTGTQLMYSIHLYVYICVYVDMCNMYIWYSAFSSATHLLYIVCTYVCIYIAINIYTYLDWLTAWLFYFFFFFLFVCIHLCIIIRCCFCCFGFTVSQQFSVTEALVSLRIHQSFYSNVSVHNNIPSRRSRKTNSIQNSSSPTNEYFERYGTDAE